MATQVHSYPNIAEIYSQPGRTWNGPNGESIPTEKEFGKQAEDLLFSVGFGFNYSYHLNHWISIKPQVSYMQKGSSNRDIGGVGGIINRNYKQIYNNRFHYFSLDFLINLNIKSWEKMAFYFQTGIRNDFLLGNSLEYDIDMFSGNDTYTSMGERRDIKHTLYPRNSGYVAFNKYTLGLVNSIGFEFTRGLNVGFEVNSDLSYLVNNDKLRVRNFLVAIHIGYRIQK